MRRMWPDEFAFLLDGAEEVDLHIPSGAHDDSSPEETISKKALKARISQQDFEKIWHLAEARYRLTGRFSGKAITLIANNPHYQKWHPKTNHQTRHHQFSWQPVWHSGYRFFAPCQILKEDQQLVYEDI